MRKIICKIFIAALLIAAVIGCEKNVGDYEKYLGNAEIVYPGKPQSLTIYQGYNRAQINALMSPDPRVVKMRLYWNSRRDSIDTEITSSDLSKYKVVNINSIPEGVYNFETVTFDAQGRRSVTQTKIGSILGDNYISTLFNRVVKGKIMVENQKAVSWYSETDTTSAMVGVHITYKLSNGSNAIIFTKKNKDTTILVNALSGGNMTIKTAYIPKNAIDTFYSRPETIVY